MYIIVGLLWIILSLFVVMVVCDFIKIVFIEEKSVEDFNKICGEKYK